MNKFSGFEGISTPIRGLRAAIIEKEPHPLRMEGFVFRAYQPDTTPLYMGDESLLDLLYRLNEAGYEDVGSRFTPCLEDHTKDSDCTIGQDGLCTICGVDHNGPPCPECGGRAFHNFGCQNS